MKDASITALIFTHNNQCDIEACIQTAQHITKNILIIDLASTDHTVQVARKKSAQVIPHPFVKIVEEVREFGIKQAITEWIFILDADERLSEELVEEIRHLEPSQYSYYKVPRKEFFAGKVWLKHGGWWPNYQIRFFKKDAFIDWPPIIHATPHFKGELGFLNSALIHYSQNDWADIVEKTIRFESTESQLLYEAGKSVNTPIFFRKYFGELFRRLIKNRGFMDGRIGITESFYQAFSKTITYLFLYEKKKTGRSL